jgi:uncharacterized Zn finger protein
MIDREETLGCPKCHLKWTPARITKVKGKEIVPDDYVRCVECKEVYYRPLKKES